MLSLTHYPLAEFMVHGLEVHQVDLAQGRQFVQSFGDPLDGGRVYRRSGVYGDVQIRYRECPTLGPRAVEVQSQVLPVHMVANHP